jgi:hypothetical protein
MYGLSTLRKSIINEGYGLHMLRKNSGFLKGTGFYRLRKNSVLYQGTTLVVPQMIENTSGFSP